MDDLEKQLKDTFARREAPPWFEARVLDAVARPPERTTAAWSGVSWMRGNLRWMTALVAGLVIGAGITMRYEQLVQQRAERERMEGEAARARLELALRITSVKLRKIQEKVVSSERFD